MKVTINIDDLVKVNVEKLKSDGYPVFSDETENPFGFITDIQTPDKSAGFFSCCVWFPSSGRI